jgi:hypothetical protein
MTKLFKIWTSDKKENRKSLSATEVRLIDGGLLPRWDGAIPAMLKDQSAIDDFRAFSAQLMKAPKKVGISS